MTTHSMATLPPHPVRVPIQKPFREEPAPHEDWMVQLVRRFKEEKFYGTLAFTFREGEVSVAHIDQSLHPPG